MKAEKVIALMDTLADVFKSPYQVLGRELHGIYTFCLSHYPRELFTEDAPPEKLDKRAEVIPIDKFLGLYSPDKQEIIIFKKGIQEAIDILQVNSKHLEIIVRIHEWAHALLHLGSRRMTVLRY